MLHLISPQVLKRPADWTANASLSGFCFLEPRSADGAILSSVYTPDPELTAFLEAGAAPLYAGFGSMITANPEALAAVVVAGAQQAGQRLILSPGWGRLIPHGALPPKVFLLDDCPHSGLYPRVQAAIHHGGAGTTAATLRYGIPSTVVAFVADQPAWGRTLEQLGVSPATHRLKTLSVEGLSSSMEALAQEDGVASTASAIEAQLVAGVRGSVAPAAPPDRLRRR